ncbi:uncharacterized protein [Coffea arabica]|uniref:SHSP domain-containing protein n=1 Tax=Coffea arabica TaxID=13443 RepID=A0A6P6SH48_COFAR|nr:inactive protein RESTRICTED TEV MOVEMENT 2-like [Coffea arabica]
MEAKTGSTARLSYEEFEPFCRWQREEACDTLLVHLPDFKKEQLRVHINNRGILKISGERKLSSTKGSKFYKEVVVARNCNTNAIQAKFSAGQLCIKMTKNVNAAAVPEQKGSTLDPTAKPQAGPEEGQATQPPQKPGEEKDSIIVPSGTPIATASGKSNGTVTEGEETTVSRGKQLANIALNVGMPVALLAALVAFVLYMYKSTIVED